MTWPFFRYLFLNSDQTKETNCGLYSSHWFYQLSSVLPISMTIRTFSLCKNFAVSNCWELCARCLDLCFCLVVLPTVHAVIQLCSALLTHVLHSCYPLTFSFCMATHNLLVSFVSIQVQILLYYFCRLGIPNSSSPSIWGLGNMWNFSATLLKWFKLTALLLELVFFNIYPLNGSILPSGTQLLRWTLGRLFHSYLDRFGIALVYFCFCPSILFTGTFRPAPDLIDPRMSAAISEGCLLWGRRIQENMSTKSLKHSRLTDSGIQVFLAVPDCYGLHPSHTPHASG